MTGPDQQELATPTLMRAARGVYAQSIRAQLEAIGAELGNLYVPGIHTDGPSTVTRILTSYALDPANNLLTEFLPDVASRVHVRIIFVQRILNNIASSNGAIP